VLNVNRIIECRQRISLRPRNVGVSGFERPILAAPLSPAQMIFFNSRSPLHSRLCRFPPAPLRFPLRSRSAHMLWFRVYNNHCSKVSVKSMCRNHCKQDNIMFYFLFHTFLFLATIATLSWSHSAFESTLNFSVISYSIVSYRMRKKLKCNKCRNKSICVTQAWRYSVTSVFSLSQPSTRSASRCLATSPSLSSSLLIR